MDLCFLRKDNHLYNTSIGEVEKEVEVEVEVEVEIEIEEEKNIQRLKDRKIERWKVRK